MLLVGIDTGGTFTDFVLLIDGRLEVFKIPSTPDNPARAVLEGLAQIGGSERFIVHGSTVATNALLEGKGAKTAFITNKGFEDILHIGRQNRERLYDLHYKKPEPLVPEEYRLGITCRVGPKGEVLKDIEDKELRELKDKILKLGVEAVAVCFLHSYVNPDHELRVREALSSLEGLHVSLSHEILPEFREYERASTTVVNAYVSPKMEGYLACLEKGLKRGDRLSIMQSNGGIISTELAKKEAVRTILSGPAGGVVSALHLGKLTGYERLITFDMGGTSTDVSLIDGKPNFTTETKISGMPVKIPMIDIRTIGAGGGSMAWIDEGDILRVGPESAGAEPGPVCYGKGGTNITVTDANLLLGRLIPDRFLGGKMKLYPELAERHIKDLSERLGAGPAEVAWAIIEIANSNMEKALKAVSVQRGYNPEEFSLISYGGAGGLHAVALARALKIRRVIIPPNPGLFSALGMLLADIVRDYSLTVMLRSSEVTADQIKDMFLLLESRAYEEMEREGYFSTGPILQRFLDMRYEGQSYELTVPFRENFVEEFEELHQKTYGYKHERDTEIVNIRLRVVVPTPKPSLYRDSSKTSSKPEVAFISSRFGTRVYDREKLTWGHRIEGPAIITEYSSTLFLPEGSVATVDRFRNIVIEV